MTPTADHTDDSYGACVVCRESVPHTDGETVSVAWPCAVVREADAMAHAARLREALTYQGALGHSLHAGDLDACPIVSCKGVLAVLADADPSAWLAERDERIRAEAHELSAAFQAVRLPAHDEAEWQRRLTSPEVRERLANTFMDARLDGPWWKPPSTLTYQEAARHYADVFLTALGVEPGARERFTAIADGTARFAHLVADAIEPSVRVVRRCGHDAVVFGCPPCEEGRW